jgi:hypothetical protein
MDCVRRSPSVFVVGSVFTILFILIGSPLLPDLRQVWRLSKSKQFSRQTCGSWTAWPLEMGPICCPETSVTSNHPTPPNVPEEAKRQNLFHLQDVGAGVVSFLTGEGPSSRIFTRQLQ